MSRFPRAASPHWHQVVRPDVMVDCGLQFTFRSSVEGTYHDIAKNRAYCYADKSTWPDVSVRVLGWEKKPTKNNYKVGTENLSSFIQGIHPGNPFAKMGNCAEVHYEVWVDGVLDGTWAAEVAPRLSGRVLDVQGEKVLIQIPEHFGGDDIWIPLSVGLDASFNLHKHYVETLALYISEHLECTPEQRAQIFWIGLRPELLSELDLKGLHKHKALVEELRKDPFLAKFLSRFCSSRTYNKIVPNRLLSVFLDTLGGDVPAIKSAVLAASQSYLAKLNSAKSDNSLYYGVTIQEGDFVYLLQELPGAKEKASDEEKKRDWKKRDSLREQAEGLLHNPQKTPLLRAALEEGHIPFGVFNQPPTRGVEGAPVNREFEVWEEALSKPGWAETIYEVARNAASRTTYERNITSWLSFMLWVLPEYLDKHAPHRSGRAWTCKPKFVSSTWELEMAETDERGTTKRRSAMTPVADNMEGIVEVPYVAVATHGDRSTWCYSKNYHLFQRGFWDEISGSLVTRDLEPQLNGRDDYGLMFYTLNGSATVQGYPTFLIIFERKSHETVVHFHRVRPCRQKDGVWTQANRLVEACYQYMAGNVPASDIITQQGDIMVMRYSGLEGSDSKNPLKRGAKVKEIESQSGTRFVFESHEFVGPLTFYPSDTKSVGNRLGFVWAPEGLEIRHPEHENTPRLEGGWFEIRRAKSYENNPLVSATFFND